MRSPGAAALFGVPLELDLHLLEALGPSSLSSNSTGRPFLLPPTLISDLAGLGGAANTLLARPDRPLRSLRVSPRVFSLSEIFEAAALRLPRPLGVRASKSLVGESQLNLKLINGRLDFSVSTAFASKI